VETVAINTPSVQATARVDRTRRTSCSTASKNMTHLPPNRGEHTSQLSRSPAGWRRGTGGNVGKPVSTGMKGARQRGLSPDRLDRDNTVGCAAPPGWAASQPSVTHPRLPYHPPFHGRVTGTSAGVADNLSSIPAVYPPVDWGTNPSWANRIAGPPRRRSSRHPDRSVPWANGDWREGQRCPVGSWSEDSRRRCTTPALRGP